MRKPRVPRSAVFESARRLARWHYQWMVTHEFLPAIVGKTTADSVYKEVSTGAPKSPSSTTSLRIPRAAPSSRSSSRWPHTASAIASPGPVTPFGTMSPRGAHSARLERAAVRAPAQRQQLERVPPAAGSTEDPVEQVLQHAGATRTARPVRQFDASLADALFKLPSTVQPDTNTLEPARAAESAPGQEDGPALGTAGGSADGGDTSHQRPAVGRTTASR